MTRLHGCNRSRGLVFSACADAKSRDGKKSIEYATKACQLASWKNTKSLTVLAAAYAETGELREAIKWQTKALETAGEDVPKEEYRRRLALYERGEPFREALEASDERDSKRTTPKAAD